jgi:hypothetical protein
MTEPDVHTATLEARGRWLSPFACFVLGSCFAVFDAATTWYGLSFTHLPEGNPALRWAFANFGLTPALVMRVLLGCAALGLLAWGVTARLPRHTKLFNVGCRVLLVAALVSWGTVSVSNLMQILYVHARYG